MARAPFNNSAALPGVGGPPPPWTRPPPQKMGRNFLRGLWPNEKFSLVRLVPISLDRKFFFGASKN